MLVENSAIRAVVERIYAGMGEEVYDLPYTRQFDDLYAKFRAEAGKELPRNDLWLAVQEVAWRRTAVELAKDIQGGKKGVVGSRWGVLPLVYRAPSVEQATKAASAAFRKRRQPTEREVWLVMSSYRCLAALYYRGRDRTPEVRTAAETLSRSWVQEIARAAHPEAGEDDGRVNTAIFSLDLFRVIDPERPNGVEWQERLLQLVREACGAFLGG